MESVVSQYLKSIYNFVFRITGNKNEAEAITLTVTGGIIGIILGIVISYFVNYSGLVETKVSVSSVLLAFSVSAAIGIAFGYYPARKASRMNPIDSLRYE